MGSRDEAIRAVDYTLRFECRPFLKFTGDGLSRIAAERIIEHLERSRFIITQEPLEPLAPGSTSDRKKV